MGRRFITRINGGHGIRQGANPVCQRLYLGGQAGNLSLLVRDHIVQRRDRVLLVRNARLQVNDILVVHTGDSTGESGNLQSPGSGSVYPCGFSATLPA